MSEYTIYVRNSADDPEERQAQTFRYPRVAEAHARNLSSHPLPAARPFYVVAYGGNEADGLPLAAYRGGMEMSDADFRVAHNTPFKVRAKAGAR